MFSTSLYAEWKEVTKNMRGDYYYVDFENIKKKGNYLFYWELTDFLESPFGDKSILSSKRYVKMNCETGGNKILSWFYYNQSMGAGEVIDHITFESVDWSFSPRGSAGYSIYLKLCKKKIDE